MLRINCLFALYLLSFGESPRLWVTMGRRQELTANHIATLVVARPILPQSVVPGQSSTLFQKRAWHQSLSQYMGLDKTKLGDLSQLSGQLSKYNPLAKKPKPLPAPDNRVNKPKGLGGTESNPHYLPEKPVNAGSLDNHSGLQKSFGDQLTWRQKLAQLK